MGALTLSSVLTWAGDMEICICTLHVHSQHSFFFSESLETPLKITWFHHSSKELLFSYSVKTLKCFKMIALMGNGLWFPHSVKYTIKLMGHKAWLHHGVPSFMCNGRWKFSLSRRHFSYTGEIWLLDAVFIFNDCVPGLQIQFSFSGWSLQGKKKTKNVNLSDFC